MATASGSASSSRARRSRRRRLAPLVGLALVAFGFGTATGARHVPPTLAVARAYTAAWERGDYRAMHALLTPAARRRVSPGRFAELHRRALVTATVSRLDFGVPELAGERGARVGIRAATRVFGTVDGSLELPVAESGAGHGVGWRGHLVFPGLRPGERLRAETRLAPRAAILARDGTPLAEGPGRLTALGALAAEVTGRVGPAPPERATELAAQGIPPGAPVGLTGLERTRDRELAGRPGGLLRAGKRILAVASPEPGRAVRAALDPELQRAAVAALAGRYGGIAAMAPADGEVLALAGIGASAAQPPGSTFKIVTLAGALAAEVTRPSESFPVATATTLAGVELENANGEACGGSLRASFAESCNSVFAPLGARLGARGLVATAEAFGFNEPAPFPGAARSSLPRAEQIGDELAVGSTAIGQGRALATALQMASVAATIANEGRRARPVLAREDPARVTRATSPGVARVVARAMRAVVTDGTGTAAALPEVRVAGKTGTAELRTTVAPDRGGSAPPEEGAPAAADPTDTDAWFVGYAPYGPGRTPVVAVGVLLVGQGTGGETAAPAARLVLDAATT